MNTQDQPLKNARVVPRVAKGDGYAPWAAERDFSAELERLEQKIAGLEQHNERLRVCGEAIRTVSDLIRLASDGDRLVAHCVLTLAHLLVSALESIVESRPKLGRSLARNTIIWPGFLSRKRLFRQKNEELLNTLRLGEGGIFSVGERHLGAPSNWAAWAVFRVGFLRASTGQCPKLSRKNKKQWFDHNWNWLLAIGYNPEQSAVLGKLGGSKAKKKPKYCKKLHPATEHANLRSEIKSRVWQAFDKIFHPGK